MNLRNIINKLIKKNRLTRGFSLLEVVVTLLVVNILLLMLSDILVLSLQLSVKVKERSHAREELTNIVNLIRRDMRNSDNVIQVESGAASFIEMITQGKNVRWETCDDGYICQYECNSLNSICDTSNPGANYYIHYKSSEALRIKRFSVDEIGTEGTTENKSISLTIIADHRNANFEIKNLYRQITISTRNYRL